MSTSTPTIKDATRTYFAVFAGLLVLTVITVAISNLTVGIGLAIILALTVAAFKASLVAAVFMHLLHERKIIYVLLFFTGIFLISMIGLIAAGHYDVPEGTRNLNHDFKTWATEVKEKGDIPVNGDHP